jgi:hypothetical protein
MELSEVKKNLNKKVQWDGGEYTLTSCVLSQDLYTKELKYSAVLLDKNKNSTVQVPIERVEI